MEEATKDRWLQRREKINNFLLSTDAKRTSIVTKEDVYQLTDDDLRSIGGFFSRSDWCGLSSQRNFVGYYNIHQPNFSAWLSGKRGNPQARKALISFITEPPTEKQISDFKIQRKSPNKLNITSGFKTTSHNEQIALHHYQIYCLIDGDNAIHSLYSLIDIPINPDQVKVFSFHNAAYRGTNQCKEIQSRCPWLDMSIANQQAFNAADFLMALKFGQLIGVLSTSISHKETKKKKIYLVSGDYFAGFIRDAILTEFSNLCDVILFDGRSSHLGYEMYNMGFAATNFDITGSQFYSALTSVIKSNIVREKDVIIEINNQWPTFEQYNSLQILPFTASMIYTALKEMNKIELEVKTLTMPMKAFQLAIKDLRRFLKKQPRQTATIEYTEKNLVVNYPEVKQHMNSWRQFIQENTILLEYGIVYIQETDTITQTCVFKSTKMIKQNIPN